MVIKYKVVVRVGVIGWGVIVRGFGRACGVLGFFRFLLMIVLRLEGVKFFWGVEFLFSFWSGLGVFFCFLLLEVLRL